MLLSTCAFFSLGCAAAQAQEIADASELPPLVVEGATVDKPKVTVQKTPTVSPAVPGPSNTSEAAALVSEAGPGDGMVTGVASNKVGSAVTIVTGAQLRAQQIKHAADALRSLPGVAVSRSGGLGALTQVRIRGAEGNHTLVLIDGIDAGNSNTGEFDFSNLLAEDIERIEVIRGGQSGIGGSKAIGGVINIITHNGKGPLTFMTRAEGGSLNTRDVAGRVSAGNDKFWFSMSGNVRETDGINIARAGTEEDELRLSSFNVKGGAVLLEGVTLDFSLRNMTKSFQYDDTAALGRYYEVVDMDREGDVDIWLGGARLTWDSFGGAFSQSVKVDRNSTRTEDLKGESGALSSNDSEATKVGYLATYRFGNEGFRNSVTGMAQREEESFTPSSNEGFPWSPDGLERKRSRMAYVGEYRGEYFDRLFPTVSVRHDDNDTFDDYTTWNAAVSLSLPELLMRPHASVGTSVSLPGMYEQFGAILGTFQGNPDLIPEESFGWDVGVEFTLLAGKALLDVTYFNANLNNEITSLNIGGFYTPYNQIGESTREGVEVSARVQVTQGLTMGASYTYLEAFDPDGLIEVRRPKHAGRIDANYTFDHSRGNLNVAAIYNGEVEDVGVLNTFTPPYTERVVLDDYWLVNVAASYKVTQSLEIFGRVENLFNERYEEVFTYNTPGIAGYGGLRFKFEEPSSVAWSEGR